MFLNRKLNALVSAHVAQGTFSGCVLVAKGKRVVFRKGYGPASAELGVPLTPEHVFRIGSVAKVMTALAAAVFGEPYKGPSETPQADVAHEVLAMYEGVYRTEYAGRTIDASVELKGDHLHVKFPLLPAARLRALSPTRFQGRLKGDEVTFDFVLEGEVTGVALDWSGTELFAPKTA